MRWHAAVILGVCLFGSARGSGDEPPPAAPAAPAAAAKSVAVGMHVEVAGDVAAEILEEAASLGDQLVPLLAAHFEAEVPKAARPLRVVIHATQEGFRQAVRAEGGTEADLLHSGGYTPRKTLISHLWQQVYAFDTRRLVLHELTHQVQDKTFAEFGPGTDTEWHREGLAEHFGWHVRTKEGLRVGAMDAIAVNDLPRQVAREATNKRLDAWLYATEVARAGYAQSLGLVEAFLQTRDLDLRERFRTWEREAWRRRDAAARFAAAFESRRAAVQEAVQEMWERRPQPWFAMGDWDELGGRITGQGEFAHLVRGWHAPVGDALVARPPDLVEGERWLAKARLLGGTGGAGIYCFFFGYERTLRLERWPGHVQLILSGPGFKDTLFAHWDLPEPPPATIDLRLGAAATGMAAIVMWPSVTRRRLVPWDMLGVGGGGNELHRKLEGGLVVRRGRQEFEDVFVSR
jgi:hypothetical protein